MKKNQLLSIAAIALLLIVSITSCSKNDPIPELDQEEYNSIQLVFEHGTYTNNVFTPSDGETLVTFTKDGTPTPGTINLTEGKSYRMKINLLSDNESINQEIIDEADEHQFFFLGSPDGVFDYKYEDDQIGLTGILSALKETNAAFDFQILLRHALNKDHAAAQAWNSKTYVEAGGADDLNIKLKIQVIPAN
ncbi:hypothetical protein [Albibacterium bauzanense]|uniref:Uncharacterized protein n=1 Tax=Albibacterium bauzanense TaxID=653929 RepID=A0A4V2PYA1_9SPHI|nr:hypothetical protein [Albibacterium bauzanense]TCK85211.1 hypothetical protein C8N28_0512 [Albibacterium bauzanense]